MALWTCNRCGTTMRGRGIGNHYASKRCTDILNAQTRGHLMGYDEGWNEAVEDMAAKVKDMTQA